MDFAEETFDEIIKMFQVESDEIISRINNSLLVLDKNQNDKDAILMLFRDAHSLKGASRMVGFNNVQTIAHKIEDILGLAKEDKLILNSGIINVLYKTMDFLAELIQKSISKKKDIYTDEISKHLNALESIELGMLMPDFNANVQKIKDFNPNALIQNEKNINNYISQCLSLLLQMESQTDENLIDELNSSIEKLYHIFEEVGYFDIKKVCEDIKVKLEFICKASHSLTDVEKEEIRKNIDLIIENLTPLFEENNLEVVDYYSKLFEKTYKQEEIQEVYGCNLDDLACIKEQINPYMSNDTISGIKNFLVEYEKKCVDENIRNILFTVIKIFDFILQNQIDIDEDMAYILKQSVEYCDNTVKTGKETADKELVLQQLEIIQRILTFNIEKDNEVAIPTKAKKITDFSAIFDTGEIKTLRIDSEKLDKLVNQVGDLIITKIKTKKHLHELVAINHELEESQRNAQKVLNYLKYYNKKFFQADNQDSTVQVFIKQLFCLFNENNQKFQDAIYDISSLQRTIQEDDMKMNLIIDDLENMVKNIRILPLATVFHLFGRMVRDIAQEKGKKIELEIIGSETSTDKKIIEEIKTPLIHIIRNAIDHGIETPEQRMALGKNPSGKIVLRARQAENNIVIEIIDDGKGINIEKIKEKAIRKGLLTKEEVESMSDEQITNIIFTPGFSTEEQITSLSGRGIGLDVVSTKISQLNGKVKIISETNKGCCVQIELPTTMSTLKVFLVNASNQTFAVPMSSIKTVLRKKKSDIISAKDGNSIIFEGKNIPLYYLHNVLKLEKIYEKTDKETVLIIESDNKIIALCVDKLIGDQEILLKKLSPPIYRLKNITGITTLVSGEVCLILNISDIVKSITNASQMALKLSSPKTVKKSADYKILLVDDSVTTRTLIKNIMMKYGYNTEVAAQPLEAFEKLNEQKFDLIVSDIEMPEMDGFEFLRRLKSDEMYADIPVIMVSSLDDAHEKQLAKDLGAIKYIIKNEFSEDEFKQTIDEVLLY